jgi:hypothetical protein
MTLGDGGFSSTADMASATTTKKDNDSLVGGISKEKLDFVSLPKRDGERGTPSSDLLRFSIEKTPKTGRFFLLQNS